MKKTIKCSGRPLDLIILRYGRGPGILWIHGGGYVLGMASMVYKSKGKLLARHYGGVVVSPEYRLAKEAPYPAALKDCYAALRYMYDNADALGIDRNRIIVGGESAGGGLAAAVCMYARDRGEVPVSFQIPLYPMLDCQDTNSSRDNHAYVWNTKRNHWGWRWYLRDLYGTDRVPPYASPARAKDYSGLPPCYTYVEDGEPFLDETLTYVRRLKEAGVEAAVDVFHGKTHGFDKLFWTRNAWRARKKLIRAAEKYMRGGETGAGMNTQKSLYEYILQSMKDGCLEDGFSLPKPEDETGISFADGALDGITVYHMQSTHLNEEGTGLMLKALAFAAEGNAGEADPAFAALGRSFRAVSIIDELQSYIIEHQEKLPASNVYRTALHLILHSADRESVKFGLSILELFKAGDESVKEAVRTLGSSDEFTIFSVWNMLRWENANREIFELIKKVRGWGRIHALERLEPETPEISDWILYCGVDNDVMPAYSALTAWEKAGVQERLQDRITQKEFEAVGRIISALLDEGPVQGISAIENAGDIIMKYLAFADSFSLGDEDRQTIEELMKWSQREETAIPEIAQKCGQILKDNRR